MCIDTSSNWNLVPIKMVVKHTIAQTSWSWGQSVLGATIHGPQQWRGYKPSYFFSSLKENEKEWNLTESSINTLICYLWLASNVNVSRIWLEDQTGKGHKSTNCWLCWAWSVHLVGVVNSTAHFIIHIRQYHVCSLTINWLHKDILAMSISS